MDELELKEYLMKEKSRADTVLSKIDFMVIAFENRRKEIEYANKQQRERETRRTGSCKPA